LYGQSNLLVPVKVTHEIIRFLLEAVRAVLVKETQGLPDVVLL
jgi:hypothetical protein